MECWGLGRRSVGALRNYADRLCHILLKNMVSHFVNQLNSNHTVRVQSKNNKNRERRKTLHVMQKPKLNKKRSNMTKSRSLTLHRNYHYGLIEKRIKNRIIQERMSRKKGREGFRSQLGLSE